MPPTKNRYSQEELDAFSRLIQVRNKMDEEFEIQLERAKRMPIKSQEAFIIYLRTGKNNDPYLRDYERSDFFRRTERLSKLAVAAHRIELKCPTIVRDLKAPDTGKRKFKQETPDA